MTKPKTQGLLGVILSTLGWPLLGGAVLCTGFYVLVHLGWITHPMVQRYFAGHPVEYVETALFCVGLVAIAIAALDVVGQFGALGRVALPPRDGRETTVDDVPELLEQLDALPESDRESHLAHRLRDSLQHVARKSDASHLDDELKHLSDLAIEQQQERYALVRIIIWATPMLGFLGTVIGITLALGNLSPTALVETPEAAMESLLAGLSVAFDTTALALSLSIVLMFCQFLTSRLESELLAVVDRRVNAELVGRFTGSDGHTGGHTGDSSMPAPFAVPANVPTAADFAAWGDQLQQSLELSIARWAEAAEQLATHQQDQLQNTLAELDSRWQTIVHHTQESLHGGLSGALRDAILDHAAVLARAEEDVQEKTAGYWDRLQHALQTNAQVMREQQAEMTRQGDLLLHVVQTVRDNVPSQAVGRAPQHDAARWVGDRVA